MLELVKQIVNLYEKPDEFEKFLRKLEEAKIIKSFEKRGTFYVVEGHQITSGVSTTVDAITNFICLYLAIYGMFLPSFVDEGKRAMKHLKKLLKERG